MVPRDTLRMRNYVSHMRVLSVNNGYRLIIGGLRYPYSNYVGVLALQQLITSVFTFLPGTFVAPSMGRSSSTSALLSSVSTSSSSLLLTSPPSPGCVAWSLLSCTTLFSCSLPGQRPRQSTCTSSWWRWWGWTSTSEATCGRLVFQHGVSDFGVDTIKQHWVLLT